MVTIYHQLIHHQLSGAVGQDHSAPRREDLELAGVVLSTDDLDEAFDLTIHRDGENWTDSAAVRFFGDRRSRRSSQEGDVFVLGDGTTHLVLIRGFQRLSSLRLPFLPGDTYKISAGS